MIKMKAISFMMNFLKRVFTLRAWFDSDRLKAFALYLLNGTLSLVVLQKGKKDYSFEEIVEKKQLTEKDLLIKQHALWRLSIVMACMAGIIGLYAVYSLIQASFHAALLSLVVSLFALTLAFRYHFWYFQIKTRTLGVSLEQWYRLGLRGKKS